MPQPLPEPILRKAYCSSKTKQLAWKKSDAIEATKTMAELGLAVTGGALWSVSDSGRIQHFANRQWTAEPTQWLRAIETWQDFCRRTADYTLGVLAESNPEAEFSSEEAARLLFHLSYTSQADYEKAHQAP